MAVESVTCNIDSLLTTLRHQVRSLLSVSVAKQVDLSQGTHYG